MKTLLSLSITILSLFVFTQTSHAGQKKVRTVTSIVKAEGSGKSGKVIFTGSEGKEVFSRMHRMKQNLIAEAQRLAVSGEAVKIQYMPLKSSIKVFSINGVEPQASKDKTTKE